MSYFDFFCDIVKKDASNNESIKGTCYQMCPQDETILRERAGLVHLLEVSGPKRQLVKSYSRSAADSNMAIPRILRPFSVLKQTIEHLLLSVTQRNDVSLPCLYDFLNDRLRAIRQDMTIQRLPPDECIQLLEPMIRFHVYFGYRLSGCSINEFDPVLNKKYLLECMKWFLYCCDILDRQIKSNKVNNDLSELLSAWSLDKKPVQKLTCDKILVESLYILCNLDDMHPLFRFLTLQPELRSAPLLRLTYEIAIANLKGNFVKICRLSEKLCPLTYCAFNLYLPTLQRKALHVMSHGYSSKQLTVPTEVVQRWLAFDSDADVKSTCQHYGLKANGVVHFAKGAFRSDVQLIKTKTQVKDKLNLSIGEILSYGVKSNC
ncbi:unnamed protein product [Parnassius apollo]|uniref:(apollo) hypothetical protein n=1 Tax=Parnassius apollo TaxID=110799 RepID=A0A8S3X9K0_PARAO|nr:unnamed protein product [Parnassius apollo]